MRNKLYKFYTHTTSLLIHVTREVVLTMYRREHAQVIVKPLRIYGTPIKAYLLYC